MTKTFHNKFVKLFKILLFATMLQLWGYLEMLIKCITYVSKLK